MYTVCSRNETRFFKCWKYDLKWEKYYLVGKYEENTYLNVRIYWIQMHTLQKCTFRKKNVLKAYGQLYIII